MKKLIGFGVPVAGALFLLVAQDRTELRLKEMAGPPKLAVPDFQGSGDAQKYMGSFNQALWSDLQGSGRLDLARAAMEAMRRESRAPLRSLRARSSTWPVVGLACS